MVINIMRKFIISTLFGLGLTLGITSAANAGNTMFIADTPGQETIAYYGSDVAPSGSITSNGYVYTYTGKSVSMNGLTSYWYSAKKVEQPAVQYTPQVTYQQPATTQYTQPVVYEQPVATPAKQEVSSGVTEVKTEVKTEEKKTEEVKPEVKKEEKKSDEQKSDKEKLAKRDVNTETKPIVHAEGVKKNNQPKQLPESAIVRYGYYYMVGLILIIIGCMFGAYKFIYKNKKTV